MSESFQAPVRWGGCLALLAGVAALAGLFGWRAWENRMPGQSFDGPPPPASAEEQALAERLDADVRALAIDIGERNERHYPALVRARDHLEARLRALGLEPTRDTYEVRGRPFDNLLADIPTSGAAGGPTLLVGAHYDSANGSPGANDNASGVAVLLALAERLVATPPSGRVRLAFFTNEEPPHFRQPTMGSRVLAGRLAARGELPDAVLVLDSVGYFVDAPGSQHHPLAWHSLVFGDRGRFLAMVANAPSEPLLREAIDALRARAQVPSEGVVMSERTMGAGWSDHASFWAHDVPAILLTDTAAFRDPHYHQRSDDGRQIDTVALARVTLGLEACVRRLTAR